MSGGLKSLGKVFKKVVKVAKKALPYALAAAAVVFTGGAALGVLPTFATAVGGAVSSLGLSAGLTGVLTGAITNAGFGAAIGGITGGAKGAQMGALGGALTGGLMGPVASPTISTASQNAALTSSNLAALQSSSGAIGASASGGLLPSVAAPVAQSVASAAPAAITAASGAAGGGLLGNPLVTSQLLQGLGGGLIAKASSDAERKARERETANYDVSGGLLDPNNMGAPSNVDPYSNAGKWSYDPRAGKLVKN